jgi:glycerol-3-phosphate O-acyltransferase
MAVAGGAVQAIFPEGGLSRDGLLRKPRIGLLDYMLRAYDPAGERDIVFIPVAINYDRVLEDRTLLLDSDAQAESRSGLTAVRQTVLFLLSQLGLKLRGRWYRFGYACANFGSPISLRDYLAREDWNPMNLTATDRGERVYKLAADLMMAVGRLVPVLPVSVICKFLIDHPDQAFSAAEIHQATLEMQKHYESLGAHVYVPRGDADYSVIVGLRMLKLRRLVIEETGRFRINQESRKVVEYYANAIAHLTQRPSWVED